MTAITPVPSDRDEMNRILQSLPKEVAALLLSVGALGFVMPGMAGMPALIVGGLVFWPETFSPLERWFERKYPKAHRQSLEQVRRYLKDLERRYPDLKINEPIPPLPASESPGMPQSIGGEG